MKNKPKKLLIVCHFFIFIAYFFPALVSAANLTVTNPRCEYLHNPEGIDVRQPRLLWELTGEGRSLKQSAYQILAATTVDLLQKDIGDLWDTQKVPSDETAHIRYAGKELTTAQQVFWKVRVWDCDGNVSEWSAPAKWSMGLLQKADWRAKWIGLEGKVDTTLLTGTSWICYPKDDESPSETDDRRYFRCKVNMPDREIKRALYLYTGDNSVRGWINGRDMGARSDHHRIKDQDLTFRLKPGENVIALTGHVPGKTVASGGVVGLLVVDFYDGGKMLVPTDEKWKVSNVEIAGWNEPGFDDSQWVSAKKLGPVGMEPWGFVRISEDRRLPARHLRKKFEVQKKISRAVVYYSGPGWSELYLNGQKVGDHVLSPGLTEYPKRVFYVTFDVTTYLREGRNAIGALLGNGRYYTPRSVVYAGMPHFGFPKLLLYLRIEYKDGTVVKVVSDESWKLTTEGPIIANNEYDGEEYDARKELGEWANVGYNDKSWQQAEIVPAPTGKVVSQMIEPIRVTETIIPVSVSEPRPGIFVFDLGQNIVGWCRLRVTGPKGTTITLSHGESLEPDGMVHFANMRGAWVTDSYTLKGSGVETWEPRFTFHGFRYVEVRGFPGKPDLLSLSGRVVNDDLRYTGKFTCSNLLLNQIHQNAFWGIRGNYKTIPMDCPQRDERQGWLGDRSEESRGEAYLFDNAALYSKWLQDIRDVQWENGSLPNVAPGYWPSRSDNVVWPSSSIIIPNTFYEHFGDFDVISENYEMGKRWMHYMSRFITDSIITKDTFGDWCVPPEDPTLIHTNDPGRITGKAVLATTYFYHDARLMEKYAKMLGINDDAAHFAELAESLKAAFNRKYYNKASGQYDNGTQTSFILPLAFGMVPEDQQTRVFNNLVKNIVEVSNSHVGLGLVGGQYLYRVLSDNGRADLAYTIATQPDYPGYGYMIANGATTIWELWNGNTADPYMNSRNHVMLLGDFIIWLYEYLAGIKPDPAQPGFKHIIMKPYTPGDLKHVSASYHSLRGPIVSEWQKSKDSFNWHITIPPNTTATVSIPAESAARVTESGLPAKKAKGVEFVKKDDGYIIFNIGSGDYSFEVYGK